MKKRTKAIMIVAAVATFHGTYSFQHEYYILYGIDCTIVLVCLGLAIWNYKLEK